MSDPWIQAFAPASVSNVGPGFDTFGFAVEGLGDVVAARRRSQPGVEIVDIQGDDGALPREAHRNTAGIAAAEVLARAGAEGGLELRLDKGMPLSSGLGSSAASAVAGAVAADAALGARLDRSALLHCAIEGERIACGAAHGDNAAPSLYGGFVLVRGKGQPRVDPLPVPEGLSCALLTPPVAVNTGEARALLGQQVELSDAITQWGNCAALVAALCLGDLQLLASAVDDVVAEPHRRDLVPGFQELRQAALQAGALGFGLSGSGPTLFALSPSLQEGRGILEALVAAHGEIYQQAGSGLVSVVGAPGARLLEVGESP